MDLLYNSFLEITNDNNPERKRLTKSKYTVFDGTLQVIY